MRLPGSSCSLQAVTLLLRHDVPLLVVGHGGVGSVGILNHSPKKNMGEDHSRSFYFRNRHIHSKLSPGTTPEAEDVSTGH